MVGVLASLPGLLVDTRLMTAVIDLRVERHDDGWVLAGSDSTTSGWSTTSSGTWVTGTTRRGRGGATRIDLLAFLRWLAGQDRRLDQVDTEALLRFLAACRGTTVPRSSGRGWRRRR